MYKLRRTRCSRGQSRMTCLAVSHCAPQLQAGVGSSPIVLLYKVRSTVSSVPKLAHCTHQLSRREGATTPLSNHVPSYLHTPHTPVQYIRTYFFKQNPPPQPEKKRKVPLHSQAKQKLFFSLRWAPASLFKYRGCVWGFQGFYRSKHDIDHDMSKPLLSSIFQRKQGTRSRSRCGYGSTCV